MMKYLKFGNFITELRLSKGLTQMQLAKIIHISNKTISKWENGRGLPDISMLLPLSKALGVSVTELLMSEKIENKKIDKSKVEEMTITSLTDSKKKYKKKLFKILVAFGLFVFISILVFYFVTTFNSVKLYKVSLNSSEFKIDIGKYMKTEIKNVFELGNIKYVGTEDIEDDLYVQVYYKNEKDEPIIIYDGVYAPIYIYEKHGYAEYFTDEFEKALKDELYIRIRYYLVSGEEKEVEYKLDVGLEFANNRLFNFENDDEVMVDEHSNIASINDKEALVNKLLNAGFTRKELTRGFLDETYIKNYGDVSVEVQLGIDSKICILDNSLELYYYFFTNTMYIVDNGKVCFNGYVDDYNDNCKSKEIDKMLEILEQIILLN